MNPETGAVNYGKVCCHPLWREGVALSRYSQSNRVAPCVSLDRVASVIRSRLDSNPHFTANNPQNHFQQQFVRVFRFFMISIMPITASTIVYNCHSPSPSSLRYNVVDALFPNGLFIMAIIAYYQKLVCYNAYLHGYPRHQRFRLLDLLWWAIFT